MLVGQTPVITKREASVPPNQEETGCVNFCLTNHWQFGDNSFLVRMHNASLNP